MTELFNNREIATGIWLGIAVFFGLRNKGLRAILVGVAKMFCRPKVSGLFLLMGIYLTCCVFALEKLKLWNITLLKETVYWVLITGFILLMNRMTGDDSRHFFRQSLFECFKVIVLIQFLVNIFTLPLLAELILVPWVVFLAIMSEYSGQKPEYAAVKKLFDWIMTLFGLFVVGFIARSIYLHHAELMTRDVLLSLLLPIWLTLFIFPFLNLAKLVSAYESLFVRASFYVTDADLLAYVKRRIIRVCRLNSLRVNRFAKEGLPALGGIGDRAEVDLLMNRFHSSCE